MRALNAPKLSPSSKQSDPPPPIIQSYDIVPRPVALVLDGIFILRPRKCQKIFTQTTPSSVFCSTIPLLLYCFVLASGQRISKRVSKYNISEQSFIGTETKRQSSTGTFFSKVLTAALPNIPLLVIADCRNTLAQPVIAGHCLPRSCLVFRTRKLRALFSFLDFFSALRLVTPVRTYLDRVHVPRFDSSLPTLWKCACVSLKLLSFYPWTLSPQQLPQYPHPHPPQSPSLPQVLRLRLVSQLRARHRSRQPSVRVLLPHTFLTYSERLPHLRFVSVNARQIFLRLPSTIPFSHTSGHVGLTVRDQLTTPFLTR